MFTGMMSTTLIYTNRFATSRVRTFLTGRTYMFTGMMSTALICTNRFVTICVGAFVTGRTNVFAGMMSLTFICTYLGIAAQVFNITSNAILGIEE